MSCLRSCGVGAVCDDGSDSDDGNETSSAFFEGLCLGVQTVSEIYPCLVVRDQLWAGVDFLSHALGGDS